MMPKCHIHAGNRSILAVLKRLAYGLSVINARIDWDPPRNVLLRVRNERAPWSKNAAPEGFPVCLRRSRRRQT